MKCLNILTVFAFLVVSNETFAQSNEAIMRRLDALENDNATLRDRVRQLEGREKANMGSQVPSSASGNPMNRDASNIATVSVPATKVDVGQHISASAVSVTMLVSVTPPTGSALIYTEGNEERPVVFRGPQTVNEVRLSGPYIYVKLIDATSFNIRYLNYREP